MGKTKKDKKLTDIKIDKPRDFEEDKKSYRWSEVEEDTIEAEDLKIYKRFGVG